MIPRRCPICEAIETGVGAGYYLCGYRDDGQGCCSDATQLAIRAIGPDALAGCHNGRPYPPTRKEHRRE